MEDLSRKQRRKLIREQRKLENETKRGLSNLKKIFLLLFGVFVLAFLGMRTYKWLVTPTPQVSGVATQVQDGDWFKGSSSASLTLIEYSDFQCPACRSYAPLVKRVADEYSQSLRVVYRHFPLSQHKNAYSAAKAAEAAGLQGKFWEMHDLLFDRQDEWADDSQVLTTFEAYAKELGIDVERFKNDYKSQETSDAVDGDISLANSIFVNSTPTFVFEGKKVIIRSYDDVKKMIEEKLVN